MSRKVDRFAIDRRRERHDVDAIIWLPRNRKMARTRLARFSRKGVFRVFSFRRVSPKQILRNRFTARLLQCFRTSKLKICLAFGIRDSYIVLVTVNMTMAVRVSERLNVVLLEAAPSGRKLGFVQAGPVRARDGTRPRENSGPLSSRFYFSFFAAISARSCRNLTSVGDAAHLWTVGGPAVFWQSVETCCCQTICEAWVRRRSQRFTFSSRSPRHRFG